VPSNDRAVTDLAGAILDGDPIDWASAESSVDFTDRALIGHLRLVASVAKVYRGLTQPLSTGSGGETHQTASESERAAMPELWGHLRLLERVGRGAFGDVYRAWDTKLDREVALKLLPKTHSEPDPSDRAIVDEGRMLGRVRHPNVVTIYGADRIENRVGLWMEFVNGRTLQQALEQGKTFSATEAVGIAIELCSAVAAVHDAGLLHRDIKPHNVMLADDGRVVLMDFGTGRERRDPSSPELAGTPLYLAPELLRGKDPSVVSDTYSLGVVLFYLLTRAYPVRADTIHDLRLAHERRERSDIRVVRSDVSRRLARTIGRAIDPEPERRYQSARGLAADLTSLRQRPRIVTWAYGVAAAAGIVLSAWIAVTGGLHSERPNLSGATLAAGTDPPVIAVLPFKNRSAEPDSDLFVDGLTDEIIRNLAVIRGLQVRSQTSSFAFKDKPRNLRDVGEQLGANLVVEGSVLRSGNRLRINAQLVQVAGDVPLWAERFDRELEDVFAIQEEISRAIVNKLRLTLRTGQRRYDIDIATYHLYLKARALVGRRGSVHAKAASELFQQVITKDPAFAPAYAGLADAYALTSHATLSPGVVEAALPLMQQAAERALELDPLLAEGHAAMGFVHSRHYDFENAEKSFLRAIELDPSLTQTYTNYWTTTLLPVERLNEAEQLLQVAMRNDPMSGAVHDHLGFMKLVAGRSDEAIDHFTRARALDAGLPFVDQHMGRALTFAGRLPEALSWFDRRTGGSDKNLPEGIRTWMAVAFVRAGRRATVEEWVEETDEPYRRALFHAALGNRDQTFEELDRAARIVPHRVVPLLVYPEMRLLRGDPRLEELRKKLGLPSTLKARPRP
jgi:TolB-like protein/Tfp pilus assembly protein PilF/predicted Ser/Thr protein kinase